MHAAGKVDFWWASVVFRTTALLLVATAVTSRRIDVRLSPRMAVAAAGAGIVDTIGNVAFAASSQHGLVSLTAVLASLYPILTVLLAASILHERVAPIQRAGIALTLAGVVLIGL
jgi:drug/metabolite transporter (DMT)-like permease